MVKVLHSMVVSQCATIRALRGCVLVVFSMLTSYLEWSNKNFGCCKNMAAVYQEHSVVDSNVDSLEEETKHLLDTNGASHKQHQPPGKLAVISKYFSIAKVIILFLILLLCIVVFSLSHEFDADDTFAISHAAPLKFYLHNNEPKSFISLTVKSPQPKIDYSNHESDQVFASSESLLFILAVLEARQVNGSFVEVANSTLYLQNPIGNTSQSGHALFETPYEYRDASLRLTLTTNAQHPIPLDVTISQHTNLYKAKVLYLSFV